MNAETIQTFTIDLPQDEVQAAIRNKLKDHAPPPGFRAPEFMPYSYIVRTFGEEFISDILQSLLTKKVNERIEANGWDVAHTMVTGKWTVNDRPLRYLYDITLELYPSFDVRGLDSLQIRLPKRTLVDDSHIDAALNVIRRGQSQWKTVDRPSRAGDRVTVNFHSMLTDGLAFPGGSGENVGIELGAGGMLPEFEQHLTGVVADQKLDFSVQFPSDYGTPFLRDQVAFFSVSVLSVAEFEPIADDELVKRCQANNMAHLREKTRIHLQRQHDQQDQLDIESDLLRQLAMANVVSLPQMLVVQQLQALQIETAFQRGVDPLELQEDTGILEQAQYRVHLSVIVRALVKQERLEISPERDFTEQVVAWLLFRAAKNNGAGKILEDYAMWLRRRHPHPHSHAAPLAARITDVFLHVHYRKTGAIVTTAKLKGTTPTQRRDNTPLELTDVAKIDIFDDIGDGNGPQQIGSLTNVAQTFVFTTNVLQAGVTHSFDVVVTDVQGHPSAISNIAAVFVPATLAAPEAVSDLSVSLNPDPDTTAAPEPAPAPAPAPAPTPAGISGGG